ncbi:MAG: glutaredoxin 3 [Gammaproteobacteria bacterium]|nr:glutaredoxin 3 [Gammaproteobacteria bacterium]
MSKVQAEIIIYLTQHCPYCVRAKSLLHAKQVNFSEIDVGVQPELRAEMIQKSNGVTSVPQIFIGGIHIGGCDGLFATEASGKLDGLLFPQP